MASNEKLFRDDGSVMMSAHALCPSHLSHPEKMRWMAEYFREHSRGAQPVACTSCNDAGDYHDPTGEWRGYCTCATGIALRVQPVAVEGMPERRPDVNKSFEGTDAEWYGNIGANEMHDAFTAWLSKAAQGMPEPLKLSDDVQEYLREGMENATGCEDDDVDFDFANGLEQLLYPLVRRDAVTPLVAKLQAETNKWQILCEIQVTFKLEAYKQRDALRAENERLKTENADLIEARDSRVTARLAVLDRQESEIDTLRTSNAELVGLLKTLEDQVPHMFADDIRALLASTGGGERG